MGWNVRLRKRVEPFLDPGERLDAVFPAQTGASPLISSLIGGVAGGSGSVLLRASDGIDAKLVLLFLLVCGVGVLVGAFATKGWIVAATDRKLVVLAAGRFRRATPVGIDAELPRQKFGRTSGLWRRVLVGDRVMRVHFRRAGPMGVADDALTRDGDCSIPEPLPGPSTLRRVLAGVGFAALLIGVMVVIFLVERDDQTFQFGEPIIPVGPLTLVASGQFNSGGGWRVEAYRNGKGHVCSRQQLVPAPSPPASDRPSMPRMMSSGLAYDCGNRFPDWINGLRQHRERVFAGQVDDNVAAIRVNYCNGSTARFGAVEAVGERWVAFAATSSARELVALNSKGKAVKREVVEDPAPLLDGRPLPPRPLNRDESSRVKVVHVSPCDRPAAS